MPVKRRNPKQRRITEVPDAVLYWLECGYRPPGGEPHALLVSNLSFDRPAAGLSRADLRELGYGRKLDALITAGKIPQDGWRARCGRAPQCESAISLVDPTMKRPRH